MRAGVTGYAPSMRLPTGLDDDLKRLAPGYFALIMATGIVSIAAQDFGLPRVATGLFGFNLIAYAVLIGLTVARAVRHPRMFLADLSDFKRGPGFFAIVAASCVLGTQLLQMRHDVAPAIALLVLGVALWICFTYAIFAAFAIGPVKPPLAEGITGSWLIAVVASQSIAVLAASVARDVPPLHRAQLDLLALSMWLWGGMAYIWIIGLIFYRYNFFALAPEDFTPDYWINMGAMAISTLAGASLTQAAQQAVLLASLLSFVKGFTVLCWATATWWIPMLIVLTAWRHLVRRFPLSYEARWWAAVFPLGMYAVATGRMATALELPFLESLSRAAFVVALAAWALTFIGLLKELGRIALRRSG